MLVIGASFNDPERGLTGFSYGPILEALYIGIHSLSPMIDDVKNFQDLKPAKQ